MKNILIIGCGGDIANGFIDSYYDKYNLYGVSRQKDKIRHVDHFNIKDYSIEECKKAIEWFKSKNIDLDILFITNGFGKSGTVGEIELEKIKSMTSANLLVPYYFLHFTSAIFQKQKFGHVIVIGSVAGVKYAPNFAMYSATKFALRALIEGFRNEIQGYNVKTTNIQPGFVETKFWQKFGPNDSKFEYKQKMTINATEVANLVNYIIEFSQGTTAVVNDITCRSVYQER
jgi:short-subunit dehydrogenase